MAKLIPPLFHENKFVTRVKEKAELFNSHFVKQCSLISNSSKLPSHIQYLTDNHLSCVSFSHCIIAKVIQNMDPNKARAHGNISISMSKVRGTWSRNNLEIIFSQCLETSVFHPNGKRVTSLLFLKKGQTDIEKLPFSTSATYFGKTLERLIFNEMLKFFY